MKNSEIRNSRTGYIFLLIFVLLSAGIAIGGYVAYRNYEKNYRAEIQNQLSAVADLKVSQLVQWRRERLGDANVFYKNDVFSDLVKRYFKSKSDADAKKRISAWMGQIAASYTYDRICLHDIAGTEQISFPESKIHASLIFSKRSAEVLKSRKVEFQDFYRDENDKKVYLTIFVPILDEFDSRKKLGILALRIDPAQYLYPMIEKWPTPSKTSETLIIRRDGNDALFLNNIRFQKDAALDLRIPLERKDILAVKAALGTEGLVEGMDYRGEQVIGYVRTVPDSPWFLVARMDMEEVYAPLRERFWLIIILVGGFIVGAGTSIGLVWRQQRSRFYREQYKSAEALRESEELLQSIIDNSTSLIYIVDTEGKFLLVNRTLVSLLSLPREKLLGQTREIVLPKDIAEIHRQNDLHVLNSGSASIFEEVNMEQDGTHTYLTVKFPLYNAEKKIYAIGGMSTDITDRKQAEEALRETNEYLENLFNYANAPIIVWDTTLVVTRFNHAFEQLSGYAAEEVIGKKIDVLFPKEKIDSSLEFIKKALRGERWKTVEIEIQRKDGDVRIVLWNSANVLDKDGKTVVATIAQGHDITERKRAEEALQESEAKFRQTFEVSPVGIVMVGLDKKFFRCNNSFSHSLGYLTEELIGKSIEDVTLPEDKHIGMAEMKAIINGETDISHVQKRYLRKNGEVMWGEVTISLVRDSEKHPQYFLAIIQDITESKQAEERLRSSEAKYRHLFDNAVEGVYRTTPDGKLVSVNNAFVSMFGYESPEEMIATVTDIAQQLYANPDDRKRATGVLREKGFLKDFEMKMRRKDGSEIWTTFNARLNQSSHGEIFFEGFISNITERKKAEEELKVNKERLLFATDGAHLGIWNWNTVTGELIWSNQCKALFGIPLNETMSYQRFSDALHPDDRERTDKAVNDALENHTDYDIEYRSLWPDGSIHWLAAKGRGFYDDSGKALRLEGIVLDITERKKTEDALRESERRLSEASKLAQLGHWIWDIKTGNVEWSDEVYNIFQLDRNEFTPQIDSILALSPWPEDHERDKELIRKAMETHEKGNYEQRFLRPDKSIGYYFSTFQGRYDDKGNLVLIVGTVQDITARKQAEEKIFTLASRQEAILSAVPDIIMEVNNGKKYTWANQAGIIFFGDDVIGKEASFYFEGEQETYKTVQPLFKGDENIIYLESWQRRKDGEKRLLAWWCRVLKDENGKVTGALSSASDITERKQAEDEIIKLNAELERRVLQRTAQLEAVNKELEAFSYSVSHDLRAPLRHVSGYVDLLGKQNKTDLSEKGQHYLAEITDSTHQMGVLIDDLLNFSRSGRVEMHESVLDMSRIVEEVLGRIRQDNPQRTIEWSVAHLPSVHCDNALMHLVWENLLSNAVKFTRTRKKAKIEIGVREEGKEIVFFVRDNGVGFDMQYAQKLFGVFQRLHPAAEYEGTGVGLANVRRIILRHGGRTWAEAELEKGATFYFSLPK